jgi:hypothetical protein
MIMIDCVDEFLLEQERNTNIIAFLCAISCRIAMGGRKAQMHVFGIDVCFALLRDIVQDISPKLFPERAFEGKMSDVKLTKIYQSGRDKELGTTETYRR